MNCTPKFSMKILWNRFLSPEAIFCPPPSPRRFAVEKSFLFSVSLPIFFFFPFLAMVFPPSSSSPPTGGNPSDWDESVNVRTFFLLLAAILPLFGFFTFYYLRLLPKPASDRSLLGAGPPFPNADATIFPPLLPLETKKFPLIWLRPA